MDRNPGDDVVTKRPSIASLARKAPLSSLQDASPETPSQTESPSPAHRIAGPAGYKSVLSKIDGAAHRQLKILALDEGKPIGDLQIEALNLLFRSRGLPEIAVRVTPDERDRKR